MGLPGRNLVIFVALCAGCETFPTNPGIILGGPDPLRVGTDGQNGPHGSAWIDFETQVRVTEDLSIEVVFPSRANGTLDTDGAPYPSVVFLQGSGMERSRYHWLASHLASRGYLVMLPGNQFDLPVLDTDRAILALRAVRRAVTQPGTLHGAIASDGPAVVMGHSLGGVIAARQWIAYTEFTGVVMLAAFPADGDDVRRRGYSSALLVAGTADVRVSPTEMRAAFGVFPAPTAMFPLSRLYAQVDYLNHFLWTDDPSDSDLTTDGPRPPDPQATRRIALTVVDRWLDATLRNDADARTTLVSGPFLADAGVTFLR